MNHTILNYAILWQMVLQDSTTILIIGILFSFYLYGIFSKDKKKDKVTTAKILKGVQTPNSSDSGEPDDETPKKKWVRWLKKTAEVSLYVGGAALATWAVWELGKAAGLNEQLAPSKLEIAQMQKKITLLTKILAVVLQEINETAFEAEEMIIANKTLVKKLYRIGQRIQEFFNNRK